MSIQNVISVNEYESDTNIIDSVSTRTQIIMLFVNMFYSGHSVNVSCISDQGLLCNGKPAQQSFLLKRERTERVGYQAVKQLV